MTNFNNYFITSLASGEYNVTVTDFYGCTFTNSIILIDPPLLTSQINIITNFNGYNISCYGNSDEIATVVHEGGTPPYTYFWSHSAGSQTTQTSTDLPAGVHSVIVYDNNGCSHLATTTLTQPEPLIVNVSFNKNVTCFGFTDGAATATATGGIPEYNYQWNDPLNTNNRFANQLPEGTWTVTVKDLNNCTVSKSITITSPSQLSLNFTVVENVSCFGYSDDKIITAASGGVPLYNYNWSNGSSNSAIINIRLEIIALL